MPFHAFEIEIQSMRRYWDAEIDLIILMFRLRIGEDTTYEFYKITR